MPLEDARSIFAGILESRVLGAVKCRRGAWDLPDV